MLGRTRTESVRRLTGALPEEPCIRKAVDERGFTPGPVGLADTRFFRTRTAEPTVSIERRLLSGSYRKPISFDRFMAHIA
jgi:hypothetical protein